MGEIILFYYTLAIMLVSIMTSALCLSAYLVSRRHLFAYAGVAFLSYFLDVALVFQDDYLLRGLQQADCDSIYFLGSQLPSIITGAGILVSLWLLVCDSFGVKNKVLLIAPGCVFVLGSVSFYVFAHGTPAGLFLFYSMRAAFLVWILLYIAVRFLASTDAALRARMGRFRILYVGMWILLVGVVVENVVFMFLIDPELIADGSIPFFPERNFAENLLMVLCAVSTCLMCAKMLSLHFKTPPADEGKKVAAFIETGLAAYKDMYGLSARETEVLREVLSGKDNQHIANDMNLALSTVKVHVHNILHKTGQANRQDLMRDFRMKS